LVLGIKTTGFPFFVILAPTRITDQREVILVKKICKILDGKPEQSDGNPGGEKICKILDGLPEQNYFAQKLICLLIGQLSKFP
jgi:hypothetical protein